MEIVVRARGLGFTIEEVSRERACCVHSEGGSGACVSAARVAVVR